MALRKQQRPRYREDFNNRMKLHLRLLDVGPHTFHLVTLRPTTRVFFSTNYFHDTWHIVSDMAGSRLLARLLWGLSYQRKPGTLIVIHGENLKPTPFEAEPSDPVILLNTHLTHPDSKLFRDLKKRLKTLPPPHQTIRWQTFGLDRAAQDQPRHDEIWWKENEHIWQQERMQRRGGFICYAAPPEVLRFQALCLWGMKTIAHKPSRQMDYHYLAENRYFRGPWQPDGEVQIFADYHCRLSEAAVARREILQEITVPLPLEAERAAIYERCNIVHRRRSRLKRASST